MTGAVDWPTLIWIVGLILAAGAMAGGIVWRVTRIIRNMMDEQEKKIMSPIAAMSARIDLQEKGLSELRLHVSETYLQKEDMKEWRTDIAKGFDELKAILGRQNERIDRVIEGRSQNRSRSGSG